jgi:peptidyl-tRNA hydrolase, PTH1 family
MFDSYLIVGLGNPGRQYHNTRHNMGFMVVEHFADVHHAGFKRHQSIADVTKLFVDLYPVFLAKPMSFMNNSGLTVRNLVDYYNIELSKLLVVCDDVALPFGRFRLRGQGSSGGHNGLNSIIDHLDTQNFSRLRIGIKPENDFNDMADFVLSSFSRQEKKQLDAIREKALWTCEHFISDGLEKTMTTVNSNE